MYVIQVTCEKVKASNPRLRMLGHVVSTFDHALFVDAAEMADKIRYFATAEEAWSFLDDLKRRPFHPCKVLIPIGHIKVHVRHVDSMLAA